MNRIFAYIRDFKQKTDLRYFEMQAMEGDADALFNLATFYSTGSGVKLDYEKAVDYLSKASLKNHVKAQHILGLACLEGKGCPRSASEALKWLTRAAEQGNVNAQFDLGGFYAQGMGGQENYEEASRWWLLASSLGHSGAEHNLSILRRKINAT